MKNCLLRRQFAWTLFSRKIKHDICVSSVKFADTAISEARHWNNNVQFNVMCALSYGLDNEFVFWSALFVVFASDKNLFSDAAAMLLHLFFIRLFI